MSQSSVDLILTVLAVISPLLIAAAGWLAKKGANYLDRKTKYLDEAHERAEKQQLKADLVSAAQAAVRSVEQTFVKEAKARSGDGKLTKSEAAEAFGLALKSTLAILGSRASVIGRHMLGATIESVVSQVSHEEAAKKAQRDQAAA